jgi:shikimate kinase
MENVVLTGFMGTGKTTVGRLLAARLGYEFVDTDAIIEERHGPIPQIFAAHGERTFRTYEREVAAELAARDGLVIATGGRMMLDPVNAEALGTGAHVFCLTAHLDTILARVTAAGVADERPLLAGPDVEERIAHLLEARADAYAEFAQIATDLRSPAAVADELALRCRPSE